MKANELKSLLPKLLSDADSAVNIVATAESSKQSLVGNSRYADRFHQILVQITSSENKVRPHLSLLALAEKDLAAFDAALQIIKAKTGKSKTRKAALRELSLICSTVFLPKLDGITASPIPSTESVLPLAVVKDTRDYLVRIVTQINGCYEHQWYDACSVMIRKLAEILIITVYEHKGVSNEIKENNDFFMLSKLVKSILTKHDWNLGRETKPCLELMKSLGDRAAHNRHYTATQIDLDKLISGLRVTVEDLLHQAGLK